MPRTNRPPTYRYHKARNCAVVTIDGRNRYLGSYGSPESHEAYARLIAEWNSNGKQFFPTPAESSSAEQSVGEITNIRLFKGLEADVVFLLGLTAKDQRTGKLQVYTQGSRARTLLYVSRLRQGGAA
jgi:superfamily I DNA and RNA helicase